MTHEPAMRSFSRLGARTVGRAPAQTPAPPQLDDEARSLIESLLAGGSTVSSENIVPLAKQVLAKPSPAGIGALTFLAWSFREAARKGGADASSEVVIAEVLEKLSADAARWLKTMASLDALEGKVAESIRRAYSDGAAAGRQQLEKQLEADRSMPVRRTEFVTDPAGRITGKVEYELKPTGGKKS